jgi:N utilization substance protein A
LSRADIKLVDFFLKTQIPEIQEGIIEIKKIARIPGFKTKIAVVSNNNSISPVGTIIGFKGTRVNEISKLINNEKIEVIEYSNDFNRFIYNVCLPVELQGIIIDEPENPKEKRSITLVVKNDDLRSIIGRKGFNT